MPLIRYLAIMACLGAGTSILSAPEARAQACPNGYCPCPEGMLFIDGICQCVQGTVYIDGACVPG